MPPRSTHYQPNIAAIDLFCGAGGLTAGLISGGVNVIAGIDADPICQFPFEENNPGAKFIEKNITEVTGALLNKLWGSAPSRLLAGCAPCQPFSTYSQGRNNSGDSRWGLLREFGRLVKETFPDYVTMENVPSLQHTSLFGEFLALLKNAGYKEWHGVVNCTDIGLPQNRSRLVVLANRKNKRVPRFATATRKSQATVRTALKGLRPLAAGARDPNDVLHRCARLSSTNLRRICTSVPGGTWRDWPASLRCKCHRKESGDGYLAVYGRLEWDKPAPTMTTQCYNYGSGRFGHPEQARTISLREAAILQGFSETYKFDSPDRDLPTRDIARLIGNAVPPPLGRRLAVSLRKLDK
jgi:DNA (cytosine-5)-methyltransferase 1